MAPNMFASSRLKKFQAALLCAILFPFAIPVRAELPRPRLSEEDERAYTALCIASVFSFGPIGIGGETSGGELALRTLFRSPSAVPIFKMAAGEAGPVGKVYALTALHALDPEAFRHSLAARPAIKSVPVESGCIGGNESVASLIKKIAAGKYDQYVSKPK